MITRSLVVIGVREGNPRGIRDWDDLTRDGRRRPLPRPEDLRRRPLEHQRDLRRGAAGSEAGGGKPDPEAARDLLARVQARVVNMDSSGRQSMATFERGTGDAVVTYENELLLQRKMTGKAAPYVIPPATLLIEGPAAVVDASVDAARQPRGWPRPSSPSSAPSEAQQILADYGFRPLDPRLDPPGRAALAPAAVHDGRPRRLVEGQQGRVRPGRGLGRALHRQGARALSMAAVRLRDRDRHRSRDRTGRREGCSSAGPRSRTWA